MNIIPKLSGPVQETGGAFCPTLPLTTARPCPFADQFPLAVGKAPTLTFTEDHALPAEG